MMRGSPGPPSGMRGGPGPNFANINNIHQCEIHMKPRKRKNFLQAWLNKFPSRAKKIDVLARVIFPAIFAFFNMSYWTFYLTQEANTDVKWTLKATILYETSACSIREGGFTLELILRPTMHKMHCRCFSSTDVWSKEELARWPTGGSSCWCRCFNGSKRYRFCSMFRYMKSFPWKHLFLGQIEIHIGTFCKRQTVQNGNFPA